MAFLTAFTWSFKSNLIGQVERKGGNREILYTAKHRFTRWVERVERKEKIIEKYCTLPKHYDIGAARPAARLIEA